MGWFEDQIQQRINGQDDDLHDVLVEMANIVSGNPSMDYFVGSRKVVENAVNQLLLYFNKGDIEIPVNIKETDQILKYVCREADLMTRPVTLEHNWYKHMTGTMLGTLKSNGTMIAILPGQFGQYYYYNAETMKRVRITRQNEDLIDRQALCFYNSFPARKLTSRDIINFIQANVLRWDLFTVLASLLLCTVMGLCIAPLTRILYEIVLPSGEIVGMVSLLVFILTLKLSQGAFDVLMNLNKQKIIAKIQLPLQSAGMIRILNLPTSFFRQYLAGDLASRVELLPELCERICNGKLIILTALVSGFAYGTQIAAYKPDLLKPVIFQILAVLITFIVVYRLRAANNKKVLDAKAKEVGNVYDTLSIINKIRLTSGEKVFFSRWANMYKKVASYQFQIPFVLKISRALPTIISLVTLLILYLTAARGQLSSDTWFAFMASYGMITAALQTLTDSIDDIAGISPLYDMVRPFLETETENFGKRRQVSRLQGKIEVNNVSFSYSPETPNVLEHLSLSIKKGEYVAIVGKTGCGKSTLFRLLLGFETPNSGRIYYDGKALDNLDLQSVRQNIGSVTQDGKLFLGDIYSNIVICKPTLTLDDAWKAAELAGIADDIRSMPMGMHTLISEDNGGISGGQRQRLMIARAIAHQPPILFFDEATSALDNISQKIVTDSLAGMNCTRLVIAHRLSTIRACDRILVLDKGKIVADGDYETLVRTSPVFAELVERQSL